MAASAGALSHLIYLMENEERAWHVIKDYASRNPWFRPTSIQLNDKDLTPGPMFAVVRFDWYSVVVVRGSTTLADWTSNVSVTPTKLGSLSGLHAGFTEHAMDVPAKFLANCLSTSLLRKPVVFTGHSRGGAIAEIAALPLVRADRYARLRFHVWCAGRRLRFSAVDARTHKRPEEPPRSVLLHQGHSPIQSQWNT